MRVFCPRHSYRTVREVRDLEPDPIYACDRLTQTSFRQSAKVSCSGYKYYQVFPDRQ
ncbi:MAG: hypothetical protein LZF62_480199 [Nitrospira sp.]|nr:MAG: hypothetical protein LZF62_480199 [Nitrospira sp.]